MKINNLNTISPTQFNKFNKLLDKGNINTICNSGLCPNRPECFKNLQLAFLLLGDICTRNCKFCAVKKGTPECIDEKEPENVAKMVKKLNLNYVVLTSVTRDDLFDGGSSQFVKTIRKIRELNPKTEIEVLIPDFKLNFKAINKIINSNPKVINHNIECCKRCFKKIRPLGDYNDSLKVLNYVKNKDILVKSGFMVGVGETFEDIKKTLKDLKENNVDIVTISQYLAPTKSSFKIKKEYSEKEFDKIRKYTLSLGFKFVFVGRNVRSSYHAKSQII